MIIDVNESNIQQELVTNSAEKNVFFYVYDATNDLLPQVTATLENLVTAEATQVVLAKGDVRNPIIQSICGQLGIDTAPAMCIFQKGQPVVISSSVDDAYFTKYVVEECYKIAKQSHNSKDCVRYMLKTVQ